MHPKNLTRRFVLLGGACSLGGCSAVSALNSAAQPLDTYLLSPAAGSSTGRRSARTLVVARPEAPAAIATDRIMVRSGPAAISYLPDARWADELPLVLQSLLVRSISETGRVGYVGKSDGGPVPDRALLMRLDTFEIVAQADGTFTAHVGMTLTVLDDKTQRVLATRSFSQITPVLNDSAAVIVAAFQTSLDLLLPAVADWVVENV